MSTMAEGCVGGGGVNRGDGARIDGGLTVILADGEDGEAQADALDHAAQRHLPEKARQAARVGNACP